MSVVRKNLLTLFAAAPLIGAVLCSSVMAENPIDFNIMPNELHVTESFKGAPITITGAVPNGDKALVEIIGATHDVHLVKKGRRGGLWMSVGKVMVTGAPSLYMAASTDPAMLESSDEKKEWGYAALADHVKFTGKDAKDADINLFDQFTKLKESQGLYKELPGALKVTPSEGGSSKLEGRILLPDNVASGEYKVTLSLVDHGKILERRSIPLVVDMKGITAFLMKLATNHGVLYGLLAVGIALLMGFIMGFLFKPGGAH